MQKAIAFLIITAFSNLVAAQTNQERFKGLFKENDTAKIKVLLIAWEKSSPNDPEFYASAFNYYFSNSKHEVISINQDPQSDKTFAITDSSGKTAGYISSQFRYKSASLNKAFEVINKGIEKFPNRLDLRFGKTYVLGQLTDYDSFTDEIIKAIEYSKTIGNNWLWTDNEKLDDAENFMLGTVQSYLKQLYDTEDDNLLKNMKSIGGVALKHYPDHVEILSTTAVANMLTKDYDTAIGYLKHAEKLNPKDYIVLGNIAQGYKLKGDKENAIKYYELAEKFGDEHAKNLARKNIKELKN